MKLLKFLLKIIVFPIALCFWILKWIGLFLTSMASWILHLVAFLIFLLGLACPIFSVATWAEMIPLFCLSFIVFAAAHASEWIVVAVGGVSAWLGEFLRS